jgi:hypothetical protein
MFFLLGFIDEELITALFILIKLFENQKECDFEKSFDANVKKILSVEEFFKTTPDEMFTYIYPKYKDKYLLQVLAIGIDIFIRVRK